MNRILTIPLNGIPIHFDRLGFTPEDRNNILFGLVHLWKLNDQNPELTVEFVFSEFDLEPLAAQMLLLSVGTYLTEIGGYVRSYALQGALVSWSVYSHCIMLEIDDEIFNPLGSCTPAD